MLAHAFFFFPYFFIIIIIIIIIIISFYKEKIDLAQAFLIALRSNTGPALRLHRLGHRLIIKESPQKF